MNYSIRAIIFISLFLTASCEIYDQDTFEKEYLVESYLIAGKPVYSVRLATTIPFDDATSVSNSGISGADVTIYKLDQDSSRIETYHLQNISEGVYKPREKIIPEPRYTYELQIITPEQDVIHAYTTIPDTFRVAEIIRNNVVFESSEQVQVKLTKSWYPGRQNLFIFTTTALAPEDFYMTPFYHSDDEVSRKYRQRIQSKIITQGNYVSNDDGTITLTFPWLSIAWFGPNEVTVHAIDDNIYDFKRSQYVQLGGTPMAPGHIESAISNIEGGNGLFGGMSEVTFEIFVDYPPNYLPPE